MSTLPKSPVQSYPFDENLPEGFNLPSPLPLSPDPDASSVRDLSPRISFSFPQPQSYHHQQPPLIPESEHSFQNLHGGSLLSPPPDSSVPVHHIASSASSASATSATFSRSSVTSNGPAVATAQPAFYTSSFHISDLCRQHPSYTSWPQHSVLPFNPLYSPSPSLGPFQFGYTSSNQQHPFFSHQPQAQTSSNVGMQFRQQEYSDVSQQIPAVQQLQQQQQQQQQCLSSTLQYCARQPGALVMQPLPSYPYHQQQALLSRTVCVPHQSQLMQPGHPIGGYYDPRSPRSYPVVSPNLPLPARGSLISPVPRYPSPGTRLPSIPHCRPPHPPQPYIGNCLAAGPGRAPAERVPARTPGSLQSPPSKKAPIGSPPQNYRSGLPSPGQTSTCNRSITEDDDDAVIFVSASMPVSQPVSVASCSFVARPPTKATIIRPIPIRIIPPPSVFSWSRPEVSAPSPVQVAIAPCQATHVCTRTLSPGEVLQVPRHRDLAVAQAYVSGETAADIIVSEGDIDVGEQVTIETDEPESCQVTKDEKLEEYKNFVNLFRSCRMTHNYTLVDVIQQVSSQYSQKLTLRSMTDFEDLVLERRKYTHIITILKVWMEDVAKRDASGVEAFQMHGIMPSCYQRKKARTSSKVLCGLENFFSRKKKNPTPAECRRMAREWKVEESFVRNWFSERRKKERHGHGLAEVCELDLDWDAISLLQKGSTIPSSSHSITVEVSTLSSGEVLHATAPPYQVSI